MCFAAVTLAAAVAADSDTVINLARRATPAWLLLLLLLTRLSSSLPHTGTMSLRTLCSLSSPGISDNVALVGQQYLS